MMHEGMLQHVDIVFERVFQIHGLLNEIWAAYFYESILAGRYGCWDMKASPTILNGACEDICVLLSPAILIASVVSMQASSV